MSNLWIRVAFAVVFALLLSATVSFAVALVYTGPKPPDTPAFTFAQVQNGANNQQDADQITQNVDRFYQDAAGYRRAFPSYQRTMYLALAGSAIVIAALGLGLPAFLNYLRFGLILSALLLLTFGASIALQTIPNPAPTSSGSITNLLAAGVPPGLSFTSRFLRFALSFIGLLVLLFMGLWRLTEWAPRSGPRRPSAGVSTL